MQEGEQAEPSSNEIRPPVTQARRSRIKRQLPSVAEVARFAGPAFMPKRAARWERLLTVADFRRLAKRRTPRPVFDYVEGAAEQELSVDRSVQAFQRVVFHPTHFRRSAPPRLIGCAQKPLIPSFGSSSIFRVITAAAVNCWIARKQAVIRRLLSPSTCRWPERAFAIPTTG